MASQGLYERIQPRIFIASDDVEVSCEICGPGSGPDQFGPLVIHYIEEHGLKPLHAKTEKVYHWDGKPYFRFILLFCVDRL